jgi:hypothetical protein
MIVMISLLAIASCSTSKTSTPEPEKTFAPAPGTVVSGPESTDESSALCAHLNKIGCEQRPTCARERAFHLSTRDMRKECLIAAKTAGEAQACGTVTCPTP